MWHCAVWQKFTDIVEKPAAFILSTLKMEAAGIPTTPLIFYANARPSSTQTLNVLQGELKGFCGGPLGLHTV
jgi:hypothetical protein